VSALNAATTDLLDDIVGFTHDPEGFALYAFGWGQGELGKFKGPRKWQTEINRHIGAWLGNPDTRHQPCRIAVASGHGIGKSAQIGMLINWALSTCEDCRVVVTANTETQLRNKTWPEVSKWHRLSFVRDWFVPTATAIYSVTDGHDKSWRADSVTWSKENTEAFAGLHNVGKRIVVIFDEASAIDDRVWDVTEGALTDEDTEIIWIAFGNPTRATGRFRECFRAHRHLWHQVQIDSRTVEGTNKTQIQEWVDTYGEDSDFVKVRVRGIFPNLSMRQYIGEEDVDAAFGKHLRPEQYNFAPVILTCDPAWEGDDALVIAKRQGLAFSVLQVMAKNDNDVHVANILARYETEHGADAVFIDMGYGTGIASAGQTMGRSWQLVSFAGKSTDPGCLNKRAEMWKEMRDWLKQGGAIPADPELRDEIMGPETVPRLDGKVQLESKADMKKRGLRSPNKADALALSFAYPVVKAGINHNRRAHGATHNARA